MEKEIVDESNKKSVTHKGKNVFAIIGFIFGILSYFISYLGLLTCVIAMMFSSLGLTDNNLKKGGKNLAIAGLILGILFIFYLYIYLATGFGINLFAIL
jgi:hypothetical protein